MPLVKLKIRVEPVEVGEEEIQGLRDEGLLEAVLDDPAPPAAAPPAPSKPAAPKEPPA